MILVLLLSTLLFSEAFHGAVMIKINGIIGPSTVTYFKYALQKAEQENRSLLVILDTPGGLLDSALEIIKMIYNSNVPVICYVYPPGAGAWSAGTLILLSCHIAAMAPHTTIGSMEPVTLTPGGVAPANFSKIVNVVIAKVRDAEERRGRNVTAAVKMVTKNANYNADEAYRLKVIDLIARSPEELMAKLNGKTITLDTGINATIYAGTIEELEPPINVRILKVLSNPTIASLLIMLGLYLILASVFAGHVQFAPFGIIALLLGLAGLGELSPNWLAVALIAIGALLVAFELHTPGFGVFGFTGVVALLLGILMLPMGGQLLISRQAIMTIIATTAAVASTLSIFFLIVVTKAIKTIRKPPVDLYSVVGKIGEAEDDIKAGEVGWVLVEGELWKAKALKDVRRGQRVRVVRKEEEVLLVEPVEEEGVQNSGLKREGGSE